jgi:hypothetical protein
VAARPAALVALLGAAAAAVPSAAAASDDPPSELHAADLGVVINMDDRLSKAIGDYYVSKRIFIGEPLAAPFRARPQS